MKKYLLLGAIGVVLMAGMYVGYQWYFIPCSLGRVGCMPPVEVWSATAMFEKTVDPVFEKNIAVTKSNFKSVSPLLISDQNLSENWGGLSLTEIQKIRTMMKVVKNNVQAPKSKLYQSSISAIVGLPVSSNMAYLQKLLFDFGEVKKWESGDDVVVIKNDNNYPKYIIKNFKFDLDVGALSNMQEEGTLVASYDDQKRLERILVVNSNAFPTGDLIIGYYVWTYYGDTRKLNKLFSYTAKIETDNISKTNLKYQTGVYYNVAIPE